jgi:FkbM family methyltransferase
VNVLTHLVRKGTVVFDVGANIGLMAVPVLQTCPSCEVISFEPSPSSLPFLQRTASESGYEKRWRIIGKALSNSNGEAELQIGDGRDALFEGLRSGDSIANPRSVKVPTTTLSQEWHNLGRPNVSVIKIDVEGAEGLVLQGANELLETCRPHLLVEWVQAYLNRFETSSEELFALAAELRYRIYSLPGGMAVDRLEDLKVQMMFTSNFLVVPLNS